MKITEIKIDSEINLRSNESSIALYLNAENDITLLNEAMSSRPTNFEVLLIDGLITINFFDTLTTEEVNQEKIKALQKGIEDLSGKDVIAISK
jgi:hypothetical protein